MYYAPTLGGIAFRFSATYYAPTRGGIVFRISVSNADTAVSRFPTSTDPTATSERTDDTPIPSCSAPVSNPSEPSGWQNDDV